MRKFICILLVLVSLSSLSANAVKETASTVAGAVGTAAGAVAGAVGTAAGTVADFAVDRFYDVVESMYEVETIIKAGTSADALSSNKLDFVVNNDFYIQLEIYARETRFYSVRQDITFQVIFPQTEILAVELAEVPGDRKLSEYTDPVTGNHIYSFRMETTDDDRSEKPLKVTFRCRPLAEGNYEVVVKYDRSIQDQYDVYKNFKYTVE